MREEPDNECQAKKEDQKTGPDQRDPETVEGLGDHEGRWWQDGQVPSHGTKLNHLLSCDEVAVKQKCPVETTGTHPFLRCETTVTRVGRTQKGVRPHCAPFSAGCKKGCVPNTGITTGEQLPVLICLGRTRFSLLRSGVVRF